MKIRAVQITLGFIGAVLLVLGIVMLSPVQAESQPDTWRDLLLTIQEKQPGTYVYIEVNLPHSIQKNGQIRHVGDNYVCVSFDVNKGEDCIPFDKVVSIALNPGIHR